MEAPCLQSAYVDSNEPHVFRPLQPGVVVFLVDSYLQNLPPKMCVAKRKDDLNEERDQRGIVTT